MTAAPNRTILCGTLTIKRTSRNAGQSEADPGVPASPDELITQVLIELTAWRARERTGHFQAWHRHGISLVHLSVLSIIQANGPQSMGRLADALDVSVASVTGIVSRMQERGLIERRDDPHDRRVVLVDLAEAGQRFVEDLDTQRLTFLRQALSGLQPDDLAAVLQAVRALRSAFARVNRPAAAEPGPAGPSPIQPAQEATST